MRALLISIRGIEEVEMTDSLEDYYRLIDCSIMTGAGYPDDHHAAWVDDESILTLEDRLLAGKRVPEMTIDWYPQPIVGNILITGFDMETGENAPATLSVEALRQRVEIREFLLDK